MHADCHIPSRLFRRRDGAATGTGPAKVPHWHVVKELPAALSQIIAKAVGPSSTNSAAVKGKTGAAAAQGAAKSTKAGHAAKAKGGKSDRPRSWGRGRAAASEHGDKAAGGGRGSGEESEDGAQSGDDSDFEDGGPAHGRSHSKPANKRGENGAKRQAAGGKKSKKLEGSAGRKSTKKRASGKAGAAPWTPRGAAQQTLLTPFGAQKVPDVSSPAGSGCARAQQPVLHAPAASGAVPHPLLSNPVLWMSMEFRFQLNAVVLSDLAVAGCH